MINGKNMINVHVHIARYRDIKLLGLTLTLTFFFVRLSTQQLFYVRWIGDDRYAQSWFSTIISYPTSGDGIIVSLKTPSKFRRTLTMFAEHGIMAHNL